MTHFQLKEAKRHRLAHVPGGPQGLVWGFSRKARSRALPALLSSVLFHSLSGHPQLGTEVPAAPLGCPSTSLPRPAERDSPFSTSLSCAGWPGAWAQPWTVIVTGEGLALTVGAGSCGWGGVRLGQAMQVGSSGEGAVPSRGGSGRVGGGWGGSSRGQLRVWAGPVSWAAGGGSSYRSCGGRAVGSGHQARARWVTRAAEAQPQPQMVNQLVGDDAGWASFSPSILCLSLPLATQGGGRGRPEGRGRGEGGVASEFRLPGQSPRAGAVE